MMGCGCNLELGQQQEKSRINPVWFLVGAGAGVGLWFLLKSAVRGVPDSTVDTVAAPMPPLTPPARYGNLQAVAIRLDQLKTLYRSGQVNPQQALAEVNSLIAAANSFSQEGARFNEVMEPLTDFKAQILDFIQFLKDQEPAPAATRGSAYA
jgi:hypothetical protein